LKTRVPAGPARDDSRSNFAREYLNLPIVLMLNSKGRFVSVWRRPFDDFDTELKGLMSEQAGRTRWTCDCAPGLQSKAIHARSASGCGTDSIEI
jgi:hypothetical protein